MPTLIISEDNYLDAVAEHDHRLRGKVLYGVAGCTPRVSDFGTLPGVPPAESIYPRIPRSRWTQMIRSQQGTFLHNLTRDVLPPHDQGSTNYCWAHGCTRALEILRVYQTQDAEVLSAESVAVPITGGRNRGGSADEALGHLRTKGACRQSFWPKNDLNERHAKDGWQEDALDHAIISWTDVQNFEDQMTLALHRVPVAIGLRWWGHLICQLDPILYPDGTFGLGCDNSWGPNYGDNGYFLLTERRGTADLGAFAPISATFPTNA